MKLDRPQHDRTAVYVIAQQYSSTNFDLFRFLSGKDNFGVPTKNVVF